MNNRTALRAQRVRLVLGTALAVGLACALVTPSNTASAESSTPIIATGAIPARYALHNIEVELLPAVTRAMHAGQSLPTYFVPHSDLQLTPDHQLVVRLAGSSVPRAFRSAQGVVDLTIHAWSPDSSWTTTLSAQALTIASTGADRAGSTWADPQDARAVIDKSRAASSVVSFGHGTAAIDENAARRAVGRIASTVVESLSQLSPPTFTSGTNTAGSRRSTSARIVSPHCPDGGQGPHQTQLLSAKIAWATIGTSYPVGRDTAWMDVTSSSSNGASYGGALAYSGVGPTASGEAFASGDWSFTWTRSGRSRSYRKQIEYTRYREYNYLSGPGCDHVRWIPYRETGGTSYNTAGVYRPNWTICARVSSGTWSRGTSQGYKYEYGEAVKVKDVLGIDLGIDRSYSRSQTLSYNITGRNKLLCGNDDKPAYAGKIMEKYR